MKLLIVVEQTETGFSAFSPDLPGCVAIGVTREDVEASMRDTMAFHLTGLKTEGYNVPEPRTYATYIEVAA